jgi:hypothetical protein
LDKGSRSLTCLLLLLLPPLLLLQQLLRSLHGCPALGCSHHR